MSVASIARFTPSALSGAASPHESFNETSGASPE